MRKLATGIALGLACTTAVAMGAFASEPSVDEIVAYSAEAGAETTEMNSTATINADASIVLPDLGEEAGSFGIKVNGTMDMGIVIDPLTAAISSEIYADVMGQATPVSMEMYMDTKDDGSIGMYMYTEAAVGEEEAEGSWQYIEIPAEETSGILDSLKGQMFNQEDFPIEYSLDPATVDVNGHNCYVLKATLTWDDLKQILSQVFGMLQEQNEDAAAAMGNIDEMLEMGDMFLSGIVINIENDVDDTTYLPMRVSIDANGSDWTILGAVFAQYSGLTKEDGSLMNVDIQVDDLSIEYVYDYDTDVEISIPDDAYAAEENGIVMDDDMTSTLIGAAEGGLEEAAE